MNAHTVKAVVLSVAVLCVTPTVLARQRPPSPEPTFIDVEDRQVRVLKIGLEDRRPGTPVVILETGAGNSLEIWRELLRAAAPLPPTVAYERAGLGQSAWDERTPTPRHVATRLHNILRQLEVDPPFVLVGFSWGGMLARYFAGYYPSDVVGLVLVDPSPMVTETFAANLTPFEAVGAGRVGFDAYWSSVAALAARGTSAAQAEIHVFRKLLESDVATRDLRPLPAIPIAVIVAGKYLAVPIAVPFDLRRHFRADLRYRLRVLTEWVLESPHGTLLLANNTTHMIPTEEPGLITSAIERVLAAVREREKER